VLLFSSPDQRRHHPQRLSPLKRTGHPDRPCDSDPVRKDDPDTRNNFEGDKLALFGMMSAGNGNNSKMIYSVAEHSGKRPASDSPKSNAAESNIKVMKRT
jgi:hypothetical protein